MIKRYNESIGIISNKINPEGIAFSAPLLEQFRSIAYSEVLTFVRLAMKGVDQEYTLKSKLAGERVKNHLIKDSVNADFEYQGSVMTNTHIRGYSDIDLLVITKAFYGRDWHKLEEYNSSEDKRRSLLQEQVNLIQSELSTSTFQGNVIETLHNLRLHCEQVMSSEYSICNIENPKSITITNKSLWRNVDVVIANKYDDLQSVLNKKGVQRGVQIYNKDARERGPGDYPFLKIHRINERGTATQGRIKKMIRFLKHVKSLSDKEPDLSSFEISSICYDIPVETYADLSFSKLVGVILLQLDRIVRDRNYALKITSVDGREKIFEGREHKIEEVKKLLFEVAAIYNDLKNVL
jgi:hypothetical protein